jgi:hypothetical protein
MKSRTRSEQEEWNVYSAKLVAGDDLNDEKSRARVLNSPLCLDTPKGKVFLWLAVSQTLTKGI